jgi:hypothetical protein
MGEGSHQFFKLWPVGLRSVTSTGRALGDAAAFELRSNAKRGKHKLGKVRGGINHRLRKRTQARPGALHVAGDHGEIGRVAREAVNRRDDDDIAVGEGGHHLPKLRPVGGPAGDLLAEHLSHLATLSSASWLGFDAKF